MQIARTREGESGRGRDGSLMLNKANQDSSKIAAPVELDIFD